MVNGWLSAQIVPSLQRGGRCRRPTSMAGPALEMTAAAAAARPLRAGLLACATVSLIGLRLAAFEMPMDDLPDLGRRLKMFWPGRVALSELPMARTLVHAAGS
jgi:hypothetical protein